MTYSIINTFNGLVMNVPLSELSQNLRTNCVLAELNTDGTVIDSWPLVHETLVTFAVEFADYVLLNYTKKKLPVAEASIALTRKWLQNHDSVSVEELNLVAHAARRAANAAYAAAPGGADAAYAANAATYAASSAASYAANAPYATYAAAATDAACAADAAYAVGKNKESEYVRQGEFIVEYLKAAA